MTITPPPEILAHTLSFLADDFDSAALFACTLASPVLSSLAHPLLYRCIRLINHMANKQNLKQRHLMRTLRSSKYGLLIRHLIFDADEKYLLDLIPHLTKLESLSIIFTGFRVIHTYPSPFIISLRNLISQPGFKSLDIDNTGFQRVDDLQYLLGEAKGLKHLGLTEIPQHSVFDDGNFSQLPLIPYPPKCPWGTSRQHISPENLTLGFPGLIVWNDLDTQNSVEAIPHFVPKWIAIEDCVLDVRKVKRLKMINSGRYDIGDIIERVDALEELELEERQHQPVIPPSEENLDELPTCIKYGEWFLTTTFLKLHHLGVSGLPPAQNNSMETWWIQSILNSASSTAPNLETIDIKLHGDFKYSQKKAPTLPQSSSSSIGRASYFSVCQFGPRDPIYDIGAMWMLCVGNLVHCKKLKQLNISLVCGQSRLDDEAVRRRRDYAKVVKMFVKSVLNLQDKYVVVRVYESSGRRLYST